MGQLSDVPKVDKEISPLDDFEELAQAVGGEHRSWLEAIWKGRWIKQEPIQATDGEIIAEPLFWFQEDDRTYACFGKKPSPKHILHRLEDAGIHLLQPGEIISD
jgi:hypothetical protein